MNSSKCLRNLILSVSLSLSVGACGFGSKFKPEQVLSGSGGTHSDAPQDPGSSGSLPPGSASPSRTLPSSQDVAAEPTPVGGAYLTCKTDFTETTLDAAQVDCLFDPMGLPEAMVDSVAFSFAQGSMKADARELIPSKTDPMLKDESGRWHYSFYFSRRDLKGPNLYVMATDKTKDPPVTHHAGADISGMELLSLLGSATAILGTDTFMPAGPSDENCSGAPEGQDEQNLGTSYVWNFEVTSESATVAVSFKDVCGVANTNTPLNSFTLERATTGGFVNVANRTVQTLSMVRNVSNPSLAPVMLEKGQYRFLFQARAAVDGVYDNIYIGGMLVELKTGQMSLISESNLQKIFTADRQR